MGHAFGHGMGGYSMSLVLEREALSNQIADDLATRNANAGLIEGAVGDLEDVDEAIKGIGWTDETVKGNADALVAHKAAASPHIMTDGVTNYSYGLSISTLRGFRHLQLNIEEEV
jgi:hypothetical protein